MTNKINKILIIFQDIRKLSRLYNTSIFLIIKRFIYLISSPQKFSPTEIFGQALLDPSLSPEQLKKYVSKENIWRIYTALNNYPAQKNIDDKIIFQEFCTKQSLPVPELLGVYTPRNSNHDDKELSKDLEYWHSQLSEIFPPRFIAKPSFGLKGYGVMIIAKDGNKFRTHDDHLYSLEDLLNKFDSSNNIPVIHDYYSSKDHKILFQRPVLPHPSLTKLCGKPAVQCVRICTVLDPSDQPHILFCFLKVVAGNNFLDNFDRGERGNLLAFIDLQNGEISRVIGRTPEHKISKSFAHHPDTGINFIGFQLPYWEETCNLAKKAAIQFAPLAAVGWDIAITPTGPVLIEGNTAWDPVAPFYIGIDKLTEWTLERTKFSNHKHV